MAKKSDPIVQAYKDGTLALFKGELDKFEELLSSGLISVDEQKFGREENALSYTISLSNIFDEAEKLEIIDDTLFFLLNKIENIDSKEESEILYTAIRYGFFKTLDFFFNRGLDPEIKELSTNSALMHLAMIFYTEYGRICSRDLIINYLLDKGVDPLNTPGLLHYVGAFGSHQLFMRLVEEYKYPLGLFYGEERYPFVETTSAYLGVKKIYENKYQEQVDDATKRLNNKRLKDKVDYNGYTPAQNLERAEWLRQNYEYLAAHQPEANTPPVLPKEQAPDKETQDKLNAELIDKIKNGDFSKNYFEDIKVWRKEIAELLRKGANVNAQDENGMTVLHYISGYGYDVFSEIIPILKDYNVNAALIDEQGNTPLFYVRDASSHNIELIKELLDMGVDALHLNDKKEHVLSYLSNNDIESSSRLIEAMLKAGVEGVDTDGETELHRAARIENDMDAEDIAELCIEKGVDVNARDQAGRTCLQIYVMQPAENRSFINGFVTLMLENGINIDAQDNEGNTAIHLSTNPLTDYIKLLEANPNLSLRNNKGISVFDVLKEAGYYDDKATDYQNRECKKLIDKLLYNSSEKIILPGFEWKGVDAVTKQPAGTKDFKIQGTLKLGHEADCLYYIGDNFACASGDIPEKLSCIDLKTGAVLWTILTDTFGYRILSDGILYFGKTVRGTSSYIAIDARSGDLKWSSSIGNTRKAWKGSGAYEIGDKIIFSTETSLIAIDKKNGKKIYKNKLKDYNLSVKAIIHNDEFIIQGCKKKGMAFYHYDINTGELIKTTPVRKGMEEGYQKKRESVLINDTCWYITEESELCLLHLITGVYHEYKMDIPDDFVNYEYVLTQNKETFDILIRNQRGDVYKTDFDLNKLEFSKGKMHGYELWSKHRSHFPAGMTWDNRELCVKDKTIEMPDYRGDCRIWSVKELYENVFLVLQAKGLEFGKEDTALIHLIY